MDSQFLNSTFFSTLIIASATLMASKEIRDGFFKQLFAILDLGRKYKVDLWIFRVQYVLSFVLLLGLSLIAFQLLVIDVFDPSLKRKALALCLWLCGYLSFKLTCKMKTL